MPAAERQHYITTFRDFPERLETLVRPLTEEQIEQRIAPNEWSTRQIVHHLADSHMSAVFRFKLPLTAAEPPTFPTYDQDAWAALPDSALPLEPSFLILRGLHARFVALLEALTEDQWAMTGTHPVWGLVTVEEVARRYANHCEAHITQINAIGAMHGW